MPLFADLDRLRADLDALRPLAPEQEARVLQKFRLEWNYNSNAIEGNSLTLGETRSLLLHGLTAAGKPMRDHLDIKGHNEAVVALEDFVRSEYTLTEQFIREMHHLLLGEPYHTPAQTAGGQSTRKLIVPGRYKTSPNNVFTATGELFYFASPEETPGRMTDLVDWYRAEEAAPTMHPVALAAEFHYRFVRIHPFDDGNGRMSRLLMNLILLRHGYPMTVIQAADRNRYLAALAEADAGEPEPFLRFIIENVEASLRLMIRAARGESIDEPSDLDKKLALLKTGLIQPKGVSKLEWNLELQGNTWNSLLKPWLGNLSNLTSHLDRDFLTSGIRLILLLPVPDFDAKSLVANKPPILEAAMLLGNGLENDSILHEVLYFRFDWGHLEAIDRNFDCALELRFGFGRWNWEVSFRIVETTDVHSPEWQLLVESAYKMDYNELQIWKINQQLIQSIHDFIAAKLAEADTPPA
jgi:Fic family protein